MWDPCGSHAHESAAMSIKTVVKTVEGPSLHWFCKLGDTLYPVLQFKDDFVTQRQVKGPWLLFPFIFFNGWGYELHAWEAHDCMCALIYPPLGLPTSWAIFTQIPKNTSFFNFFLSMGTARYRYSNVRIFIKKIVFRKFQG